MKPGRVTNEEDAFEAAYSKLLKDVDTYRCQLNHEYVALGFMIHADYITETIAKLESIRKIASKLHQAQEGLIKLDHERFNQGSV